MNPSNKLDINGLLLLDKPVGPSSNSVLQQVKRLFQAKKVGHTGSLDPLASGMLPLCFGETTKFANYLLEADKCYQAKGRLGIKTATADAEGEIIAQRTSFSVSRQALLDVIGEFPGKSEQIPSMYSALKHQGQPLYRLARKGLSIERAARTIEIQKIDLLAFDGRDFVIEVVCSKGTYIRNLVEDIGEKLAVFAHVRELRRIYTAGLQNEKMVTLDQLKALSSEALQSTLFPVDKPVDHLPKLSLTSFEAQAIRQGKSIMAAESIPGLVRLYDNDDIFIGTGAMDETLTLRSQRLITA